tara:strand:- start:1380 stop:1793 length:414 start_codon:yes stop_codon:yes gene_type:complete
MGNEISINKIGFEDVQFAIQQNYVIINTLSINKQECLIRNTINYHEEEDVINDFINNTNSSVYIIIYGENYVDKTAIDKYIKLAQCGFTNLYLYCGGLFEWLLLQDIYGNDNFPTTGKELDILKFRTNTYLNKKYLK